MKEPLSPVTGGWTRGRTIAMPYGGTAQAWQHAASGACALSATEPVLREDGSSAAEWHVSVSIRWCAVADNLVVAMVIRDFAMAGAFEDNHQPGIVRNFWLACDIADRQPQCACVANEKPHEEGCRVWRDDPDEAPR